MSALDKDKPFYLLANDTRDLEMLSNFAALEGSVEEIDVQNGEYQAWDYNGIPLSLGWGKGGLVCSAVAETAENSLELFLRTAATECGITLSALDNEFALKAGYEKVRKAQLKKAVDFKAARKANRFVAIKRFLNRV
jgi:hypothetical protein